MSPSPEESTKVTRGNFFCLEMEISVEREATTPGMAWRCLKWG